MVHKSHYECYCLLWCTCLSVWLLTACNSVPSTRVICLDREMKLVFSKAVQFILPSNGFTLLTASANFGYGRLICNPDSVYLSVGSSGKVPEKHVWNHTVKQLQILRTGNWVSKRFGGWNCIHHDYREQIGRGSCVLGIGLLLTLPSILRAAVSYCLLYVFKRFESRLSLCSQG